jgi:hypothetical protein
MDLKENGMVSNYPNKRFYHKRKETKMNANNSTNSVNNGSFIVPSKHDSEKVSIINILGSFPSNYK